MGNTRSKEREKIPGAAAHLPTDQKPGGTWTTKKHVFFQNMNLAYTAVGPLEMHRHSGLQLLD